MSTYVYPARITRAPEGGWNIRFRDLPDALSQAGADEDAVDIAEGCLQAAIEGRLLYHDEIPEPSAPRPGEVLVAVPLETAAKAALLARVAASSMSQVALAKAVGLDEKEIRRMLDPSHSSKLPRLARVLRVLGQELQLSVVDAAQLPRSASGGAVVGEELEAMQRKARYRVAGRRKANGSRKRGAA